MSVKAYGTVIQSGDTADYATTTTWTGFAKVKSVKPAKKAAKNIDVTHLTSPDEFEEAIPGLASGGELEVMAQYAATATGTIDGMFRVLKAFRLVYPDLSGWKLNGYVSEVGDEEVVNGDIIRTTFKIKVTGKPVPAGVGSLS